MEQKQKKKSIWIMITDLSFRKKLDKIKEIYKIKTDSKTIIHLVDLELKRQGLWEEENKD